MKIPYLALVFVLVAMVFVGATAFGDVNQFELEAGLTVEALVLPEAERTVEASGVYFTLEPLVEYTIANYRTYTIVVIAVLAFMIIFGRKTANIGWGMIRTNVGVRIFGPLQCGLVAV